MFGLPSHHILRPRLTGALSEAPVGVVEAGGGYGKSTLAGEFGAIRGIASVVVPLDDRHGSATALVAAVRSALSRAGMRDAATVVGESPEPRAAMDALAAALERGGQEQLLVFDDAHHLSGEGGALVAHLAQRWPERQRLLVVARHLPSELRRVRHLPGCVLLDSTDLALTCEEVAQLAERSRLSLSQWDVEQLVMITDGWAAAIVLALPLLARAASPAEAITQLRRGSRTTAELVDEHLAHIPEAMRAPVARALQLPLITTGVVEKATGIDGLLDVAARAGLPVTPSRDGTWLVPHPVVEALAARQPLDAETARPVAAEYLRIGEAEHGISVLLDVGDSDAAAGAIERLRPRELDGLGLSVLRGLVTRLPLHAVEAHPQVLLHVARACEPVAAIRERSAALQLLEGLAVSRTHAALLRAVEAEHSRDLVRDDEIDAAEELASRVLDHTEVDELETRVRALDALGRTHAWRREPRSLQRGERLLTEALETCRRLGQNAWAAQVVLPLAISVHYASGDFDLAVRRIDEALAELNEHSVHRPVMLTFRAEVLINCGRYDEASAALSAALHLADRLGDDRGAAYAHWDAARSASQRGDAVAMMAELEAVEAHRSDWFDHGTGAEFLADAADLCDRVGRSALAWSYAERALERRDESEGPIRRSLAAVAARSGDPIEAERALTDPATLHRLEPRERWWITLLRAFAAVRRGDPRAGPLAARAYDEAAAIGHPGLPLLRERVLSDALIGLAVGSGSVAARELGGSGLPPAVTLLGRFGVTRGGQPIAGLDGRPAQVVKVVATLGPSSLDVVAEALWRDADTEGGRQRLRNVLARLRDAAGDIVIRDGSLLKLADDAMVDADLFEEEATRAIALAVAEDHRGVAVARAALARYVGELLPGEVYLDWAEPRRERLRTVALDLLDLLVEHDLARGDANEAARLLERALALEPFDEARYLLLADLHRNRGATARALEVVRRGQAAMRELGVRPSARLAQLDQALAGRPGEITQLGAPTG